MNRIVLLAASGDVLFSGVSVAQEAPAPVADDDDADVESCPETKRSARLESGLFPVAKRSVAPSPTDELPPSTQSHYDIEEGPRTQRGAHAA